MAHHALDSRHTTRQLAAMDYRITFAIQGQDVHVGDTVTAGTVDGEPVTGSVVTVGLAVFVVQFTAAKPAIPAAAVETATAEVFERLTCTRDVAERVARNALTAALPHLLDDVIAELRRDLAEAEAENQGRMMGYEIEQHIGYIDGLKHALSALLPDRAERCERESTTPDGDRLIVDCTVHGEIGSVPASGDEFAKLEALFGQHRRGAAAADQEG